MSLPIKIDKWDSHFFNATIARVQLSGSKKDTRLSEKLYDIEAAAEKRGVKFLVVKLDSPTAFSEKSITSLGFNRFGESVDLLLKRPRLMREAFSTEYRIRPFAVKDNKGVKWIAKDAFRLSYLYRCGFGTKAKVDSYHSYWVKNLSKDKDSRMFVAEKSGRIVGFVGMNVDVGKRSARIRLIAVDKRFRGHGIGSALIQRCIEWARGRLSSIYVKTQKNNRQALAVYKKMGFREVACDQVFCKKIA